jgi:hypothetical protein
MRFFVLLFGAVLMVAGAASVAQGVDIIQAERGWTEVISGSVVFAAGAMIVALGFVIAKLDQLVRAMQPGHATALLEARASIAEPAISSDERALEPGPVTAVGAEKADAERDWPHPPAPPVPPAAVLATAETAAATGAQGANGHWLDNEGWPPPRPPDHPASAASLETDGQNRIAAAGPVVDRAGQSAAAAGETNFEWLEQALSGTEERQRQDARRGALQESPTAGTMDQDPMGQERSESPKDRREQHLSEVNAPDPQPSRDLSEMAPTAADPAILGRYQANGNSYVMFSDGSIEAVTQTGVYRFGSMAELKAFIEAQA